MRITTQKISASLGCLLLLLFVVAPASALNTMLDYTSFPPIVSEPTKPNVLIMISNDHTGFYSGYNDLTNYDNKNDYWGYFDPRKEYSYKGGFNPEGFVGADHYTTNKSYWSGNFLNWVTMTHADFLRKALTGGQRRNDATAGTTISRAAVPADHAWKKQYAGADIVNLVPSAYASNSNYFSNLDDKMDIQDSNGGSLTKNKPLAVLVTVCDPAMPESNCTPYPAGNMKPEGLLQRYHDKMLFGLMSYSHSKPDRGGVIRTPIRDISNEFSLVNGGDNSSSDSMLTYIARYTPKGWDPLGEMFYDGVRYFRGNEGAQAGFCPSNAKDDNYFYFGCSSTSKWEDPVLTWCQKNNIIIINDEYPSRDGEEIPNSAFAPTYADNPAVGLNVPYEPDVTAITKMIGDNEGITNQRKAVGKIIGRQDGVCTPKRITNLGEARGICPGEPGGDGTFYLAALAYDAFVGDMRDDFDGDQGIRTYGIAFRASPGGYKIPSPPLNQMWLAGKYGNFDDKDGNNLPNDIVTTDPDTGAVTIDSSEWMKSSDTCNRADPDDYDCLPKGFFYAEGGSAIEDAIVEVFESIMRRAASGTAVSILATSGQGEGNLVQAYYRPAISEGTKDVTWTGYMQSMWIDKYGNLREDTELNQKLDEDKDRIIKYFQEADGTSRARLYDVSAAVPYPDTNGPDFDEVDLDGLQMVWEAGEVLSNTASSARKILTFTDINEDGVVDSGEVVDLDLANKSQIKPYLAVQDDFTNANLGLTEDIRTNNLISFIRGEDPTLNAASYVDPANVAVRDRVLGGKVWKLGDIIQSTPVAVAAPSDRLDLIYGDESYIPYYIKYRNRETMIYAGANDGMFHAFTSWEYDQTSQSFTRPSAAPSGEVIGSEVWAYVPQSVLPHLKWLARQDYTHVHYLDLQPRIFDARIFNNDTIHPNGWGTVMIVGMNTGGGLIQVTGDFDSDGMNDDYREFKPSFMFFDITDPRNPELLWERTYDGLGFTRAIPTPIRIGKNATDGPGWDNNIYPGDWYLAFGNGPDAGDISGTPNYQGETNATGHIYIVDMKTGKPYSSTANGWWAEVTDEQAFFNTPIAFDRDLNYNVDAVYMATSYDADKGNDSAAPHDWKGSVYRVLTWDKISDTYFTDPSKWSLQKLFDSPRPITAPGSLSTDRFKNTWAYFGTGRYISKGIDSDETSTDQEYMIGIKDPLFNKAYQYISPLYYENITLNKNLDVNDLLDASPFLILSSGQVLWDDGSSYVNPYNDTNPWYFQDLLNHARTKDGWIRELPVGLTAERSLNKPTIFGGLTLFTTFSPKGDVCDYGGFSTLWALYFETGTAFKRAIFRNGTGEETIDVNSVSKTKVADSFNIGSGQASSVGVHVGKQNENAGADRYSQAADGTFYKDPNGTYIQDGNEGQPRYTLNPDGSYSLDPNGGYVKSPSGDFHDARFAFVGTAAVQGDAASAKISDGGRGQDEVELDSALSVRSGLRSWMEN